MRHKHQRGMTLLEVLAALVILAVGCLAIFRATSQQIRSLSQLESKRLAYWVADNQLTLAYLSAIHPTSSWQQGSHNMAGQQWYWRIRRLATTDASLYAIEVEVSPDAHFVQSLAQLRTWVPG